MEKVKISRMESFWKQTITANYSNKKCSVCNSVFIPLFSILQIFLFSLFNPHHINVYPLFMVSKCFFMCMKKHIAVIILFGDFRFECAQWSLVMVGMGSVCMEMQRIFFTQNHFLLSTQNTEAVNRKEWIALILW